MEIQIFSPCKNILLKKNPLKQTKNQNPSRFHPNSIITNLKFQHKPKYHLSKNHIMGSNPKWSAGETLGMK
jgi:hypothetical protein